jgi:hypothetical protein
VVGDTREIRDIPKDMKTIPSLLFTSIAALCGVSCSNIGRESRERWASQPNFVSGDDSLLEGTYMNRPDSERPELWRLVSDRLYAGDAVQLRLIGKRRLEITLFNQKQQIASTHRTITRRGKYWSIGSAFQIKGVPPLVWGIKDKEVGLAIDRDGNLNTSYGISGAAFVGPMPLIGGGDSAKRSSIHRKITSTKTAKP